jgi:uncharacterized protein YgiM (DUF1202 family)
MSRHAAALVLAVALLAAACGDDAAETTVASTTSTTVETATSTAAPTTASTTTTTLSFPFDTFAVDAVNHCVIQHTADDALNVREGPGVDYAVIGTLAHDAAGVATTGFGANDDDDQLWVHVTHEDATGWVASWLLTPGECFEAAPGEACVVDTVCTDRLNVRSGPGGDYPKIGSLAYNVTGVVTTGRSSNDDQGRAWIQIEYDGEVGWAAGWFLTAAPCSASLGLPCACPADETAAAFIHEADALGQILRFDPVVYHWIGPADTEYEWLNDDTTIIRLPIADDVVIEACPEDMTGDFPPQIWCGPDELVPHSLSTFAGWIAGDVEVGQNARWDGLVPGSNSQMWYVTIEDCEVTEITGMWFP